MLCSNSRLHLEVAHLEVCCMPKSAWREGGASIIVIAASTLPPPPLPPTPALCHLPQDKGSDRVASQVLSALAYLAPDLVLVSPACLLSICFRCLPARRPAGPPARLLPTCRPGGFC
jgi:hypothetical protein